MEVMGVIMQALAVLVAVAVSEELAAQVLEVPLDPNMLEEEAYLVEVMEEEEGQHYQMVAAGGVQPKVLLGLVVQP
jgi:hypothetical protein